ncbi:MAG: hypothetical protein ACRD96_12935, partial [Bryobacteraceae bacterium]
MLAAALIAACGRKAGVTERAVEAALAGRWDDVERIAAGDVESNIVRGYAALERGEPGASYFLAARGMPGVSIRKGGKAAMARVLEADALARAGDRAAALDRLNAAVAAEPRMVSARIARLTLRAQAGDRAGALADVDALGPHAEALVIKSRVLAESGDLPGARSRA